MASPSPLVRPVVGRLLWGRLAAGSRSVAFTGDLLGGKNLFPAPALEVLHLEEPLHPSDRVAAGWPVSVIDEVVLCDINDCLTVLFLLRRRVNSLTTYTAYCLHS